MAIYSITKNGWYKGESGDFPTKPTTIECVQAAPPTLAAGEAAVWDGTGWLIVTDQGQANLSSDARSVDTRVFFSRMTKTELSEFVNADNDEVIAALGRTAMTKPQKVALRTMRFRLSLTPTLSIADATTIETMKFLVQVNIIPANRVDDLLKPSAT